MPIKTFFPDGRVMFDSGAVQNGVCLGLFVVPAGTTLYKQFPLLQGATLRAMSYWGTSTDYSGNVGMLTINNSGIPSITVGMLPYFDQAYLVWATGTPSILAGAGMQALNSAGNVALCPNARGLNFIGLASYVDFVPSWDSTETDDDGQPMEGECGYRVVEISSPASARPIGIVKMVEGSYIANAPIFKYVGSNKWRAEVRALSAPVTLSSGWPSSFGSPDVYCFATPSSAANSPRCAVWDTDGTLAYDLLAGKVMMTNGHIDFSNTVSSQTAPSLSAFGIFGTPALSAEVQQRFSTVIYEYEGLWHLSGSAIEIVRSRYRYTGGNTPPYPLGSQDHTYRGDCGIEIFDLSGY